LGQGAEVTGRVFGLSRIPTVKGQGVPAHDPRKEVGTGIGYATSPQGADHTGVLIFEPGEPEQLAEKSWELQITNAAVDAVGLCLMTEVDRETIARLLSGFYGSDWNVDDVAALGKSVLKEEISFNQGAGLGSSTDRLPDLFAEEALPI
jgi:aldehyde:ferredoxin oxidoreductase